MPPAQIRRRRGLRYIRHVVPFRISRDGAGCGESRIRVAGVEPKGQFRGEQRLQFGLQALDARIRTVGSDAESCEVGRQLRVGPALEVSRDVGDQPMVEECGFLSDLVVPHRVRGESLGRLQQGEARPGGYAGTAGQEEELRLQTALVARQHRVDPGSGRSHRNRLVHATEAKALGGGGIQQNVLVYVVAHIELRVSAARFV